MYKIPRHHLTEHLEYLLLLCQHHLEIINKSVIIFSSIKYKIMEINYEIDNIKYYYVWTAPNSNRKNSLKSQNRYP